MLEVGSLRLDGRPIMNAAGTLSKENVEEVRGVYGALVTKTVTPEPRRGNPPPRLAEATSGGMVNSIGLQNPGVDRFLEEDLEEWASHGLPVVVSVGGSVREDFEMVCRRLLDHADRVAAVEVNLSCPNLKYGNRVNFCSSPHEAALITQACARWLRGRTPILAKLAAENCSIVAPAVERAGADAITLINTVPALAWLPEETEPLLGGLSGPAIKPIALRAVYEVSRRVRVPVIGCGGIGSGRDVAEFAWAGAAGVQIGSASFAKDPWWIVKEWEELR